MPEPTPRQVRDPKALRALAHPLRIAIIEQLTIDGPLTASQLADRVQESPANCSWHLRKLAEFELVEEAGGGVGRERPWQVSSIGFSFGDTDDSVEARRAGNALYGVLIDRQLQRALDARDRLVHETTPWRDAAHASEYASWLTVDELREVGDEIEAVLRRYHDRLVDPSKRPERSRLCEFVFWGTPIFVEGVRDGEQ